MSTADERSLDEIRSANAYARARDAYQLRLRRSDHFTGALFGEPAWDVLLLLFSEEDVGKTWTEAAIADAMEAPASVTARWIRILECEGMVQTVIGVGGSDSSIVITARTRTSMLDLYSSNGKIVPSLE